MEIGYIYDLQRDVYAIDVASKSEAYYLLLEWLLKQKVAFKVEEHPSIGQTYFIVDEDRKEKAVEFVRGILGIA